MVSFASRHSLKETGNESFSLPDAGDCVERQASNRWPGPVGKVGGSRWEHDGFTCRMLTHGIVTIDPSERWFPDAPPLPASMPPAKPSKAGKEDKARFGGFLLSAIPS